MRALVWASVNSVSELCVLCGEWMDSYFPALQPPSIRRQLPVTMAASSLAR